MTYANKFSLLAQTFSYCLIFATLFYVFMTVEPATTSTTTSVTTTTTTETTTPPLSSAATRTTADINSTLPSAPRTGHTKLSL